MTSFMFRRIPFSNLLLAVVVVFWGALSFTAARDYWRAMTPVTDWFEPISLQVEDFVSGDDPTMFYAREIRQQFWADWSVKVIPVSPPAAFPACTGRGQGGYGPLGGPRKVNVRDMGKPVPVKLSTFIGRVCEPFPPGQYRIDADWYLKRDGYAPTQLSLSSNVFTVLERKTP